MKQISLEKKISKMKVGEQFRVGSKSEREAALRAAKVLFRAGLITFRITTYPEDGAFVVSAI